MEESASKNSPVKEIVESIETGLRDLFQSDKYKNYLKVMSKFHHYSINNSILIYSQFPEASMVAGYEKWKEFGRNVKKGEKGIHIIAPTLYHKKVEEEITDYKTGEKKKIQKTVGIPGFKRTTVFDISQTEGKPLPKLVSDIKGDVKNYETFLKALMKISPVPVYFGPKDLSEDGRFDGNTQKITIKSGMSEKQTISALVHEIAHSLLHNEAHPEYRKAFDKKSNSISRSFQEVEAESIAYTVCSYYGIDTSENSFGYIASWSKDKNLSELKESLETILSTARIIIEDMEKALPQFMGNKTAS